MAVEGNAAAAGRWSAERPYAGALPWPARLGRGQAAAAALARAAARAAFVAAVLWLFLVGLHVMRAGAQALAPRLEGSALTDGLASPLGLGWLGAMLVLSGSPVAASSLALLDGGTLTRDQAFMMLTGSRLGAAFVVLAIGFLYAARGRAPQDGRRAPLSVGVLALLMTAAAYLPGAAVGLALLRTGALAGVPAAAPPVLLDLVGAATRGAVAAARAGLPGALMFPAGLVLVLASLRLAERALPTMEQAVEERGGWRTRTWLLFGIGCAAALATMSVSVALTLLVPAVAKGALRREHTLPYIAGANLTTLADTLATALLLGDPDAVRVVAAELLGVAAVSLVLLSIGFGPLRAALLAAADWLLASRPRCACFIAALFAIPVALIWAP